MRILWLASTAAGAAEALQLPNISGGWIESLEKAIKKEDDVDLGICFFFNGKASWKFEIDNVVYYPIKNKLSSLSSKIKQKLFNGLFDENRQGVLNAIDDFKPDIIQIFGTESGFVKICSLVNIPIVVHIQGIINPYINSWYPKGISSNTVLLSSRVNSFFTRKDYISRFHFFSKMALRESTAIKKVKYFFGRTDWDRRVIKIYNRDAKYFHVDELLRAQFSLGIWRYSENNCRMFTIINPQIYKGLEIIFDAALLLDEHSSISYKWHIAGISASDNLVYLIEKIKKKRFSNSVKFLGRLDENSILKEMLDARIFVHPSHIDNSPNSVCEAMMVGMPVLAGNVGGLSTLIENGFSGLLYNSHDVFDLCGHIIDIWNDSSKLSSLGVEARNIAREKHSDKLVVNQLLQAYQDILKSSKLN